MFYRLVLLTLSLWPAIAARGGDLLSRSGNHLRLTSDFADASMLDDFVDAFDVAVPQWLSFWNVPLDRAANWKIDGFLMQNVERFRRDGSLPADVPDFANGFASPTSIWVREQPSRYYNRHLILHEGVHSLAIELFGGGGPSWYMEGTAELLSTHRDRTTNLSDPLPPPTNNWPATSLLAQRQSSFRIAEIPRSPADAPHWGRFSVIEKVREQGKLPSLRTVLNFPTDLRGDVESYAWSWAAAILMARSPRTREAFVGSAREGADQSPAFTAKLFTPLRPDWPVLDAQWRLLLHDLEFGFDPASPAASLSVNDPRDDGRPRTLRVTPDKTWHSVGVWFPARTRLSVVASGQCELSFSDKPVDAPERFVSEPAGITSAWHRGSPVGQLRVCVLPIAATETSTMPDIDIRPAVTLDQWPMPAEENATRRYVGTAIQIDQPSWVLFQIHNSPLSRSSVPSGGYDVVLQPADSLSP